MKKNVLKSFGSFCKRNIFYIVLTLSIVVIGLATTLTIYYATRDNISIENTNSGDSSSQGGSSQTTDSSSGDSSSSDSSSSGNQSGNNGEDDVVVDKVITFILPVNNATIIKDYSETELVYNATLNRYTTHTGIDFSAEENSEVFAVYDGVVESVVTNLLTGVTLTIDHGNELKTIYNSISSDVPVQAGDVVSQGDVIGYVSTTNLQESEDGAHLHFEVMENGVLIDPNLYLMIDEK